MQELLIGQSNQPGIFNIFRIKQGRIAQICNGPRSEAIPQDVPMETMPLPYELVRIILFKTIYWLLKNKCIEEACELMSINKDMIHWFHTRFCSMIQVGDINYLGEHRRLSRTLCMVSRLHDMVTDEINYTRTEHFCFEAFVRNPKYQTDNQNVEPLDFYRKERGEIMPIWTMMDMSRPVIVDQHCYKAVITGSGFLDVAWLMGHQGKTLFRCLGMRRPIFVFCLSDPFGTLICPEKESFHYYVWHLFADLLKVIYGLATGVYLVTSDHVPLQQELMTMEIKEINF